MVWKGPEGLRLDLTTHAKRPLPFLRLPSIRRVIASPLYLIHLMPCPPLFPGRDCNPAFDFRYHVFPSRPTTVVSAWLKVLNPVLVILRTEPQLGSGQVINPSDVIQSFL